MAGLFFCLASAEGAGLLFCYAAIQQHASVYSGFYPVHTIIRPTPQNSAQSFIGAFTEIFPILPPQIQDRHKRLYITCATLERITTTGRPPAHTRYHRHARTLHKSSQQPYYNKAYKMVQHTADHASPAGSAPAVCGSLASADTLSAVQTRRTC